MRVSSVFVLLVAVLPAGCASRPVQLAVCSTAIIDSTWLGAGPIYTPCTVDDTARLISGQLATPDFIRMATMPCYSALIEFVVGTNGMPEPATVRVVRTTSSEFARSVQSLVPNLRYEPARRAGTGVRQVTRWGMAAQLRVSTLVGTSGGRTAVRQHQTCVP